MRCYNIVRHILGHQYHRNTRLYWLKSDGKAGPREGRDLSFLSFTGACIATWNKERPDSQRRITYYEIFLEDLKVPADLKKKLEKSGFPPPLLAVACCDIMRLNLHNRGEPYSSSKQIFQDTVQRLAAEPDGGIRKAIEISNRHLRGESLGKTVAVGNMDEVTPARDYDLADIRPGTKVHKIEFYGGFTISRRMACYWRGKSAKSRRQEYKDCVCFIFSLLKKPWPMTPSTEGQASTVPLFNALLERQVRKQLASRHQNPAAANG